MKFHVLPKDKEVEMSEREKQVTHIAMLNIFACEECEIVYAGAG